MLVVPSAWSCRGDGAIDVDVLGWWRGQVGMHAGVYGERMGAPECMSVKKRVRLG